MANVNVTVFDGAASTPVGDPEQYLTAVIGGANSSAVLGSNRKRWTARFYAESDCWLKWGANPTATGASDSVALGADNPEYFNVEAGHVVTAITRV